MPLVLEARALLAKAKDLAAQDVGAARELLRAGPYKCVPLAALRPRNASHPLHTRALRCRGFAPHRLPHQPHAIPCIRFGTHAHRTCAGISTERTAGPPTPVRCLLARTPAPATHPPLTCTPCRPPRSGLRDNIRAIGEYAARDGRTTEVGPLVTGFFKALEGYDQLLLNALRDKTPVEADKLDACIADLYAAFDKLIATVPADILEQAQRVLDVTMAKAAVRQEEPAGGAEGGAEGGQGGAGAVVVDQEAAELLQLLR